MKRVLTCTLVAVMSAQMLAANPVDGQATYDLLFKTGTLDAVSRNATLIYSRDVSNTLKPEAAKRDTGAIALSFATQDSPLAQLEFRQDEKFRRLGQFPASVGNPMIMYFYEATVRDMAEVAGGSPFYIRNRVKDSLIQPSDVELGEAILNGKTVRTKTIRLHPFADDPNKDRMDGFGDLELRVTMSDDVPGWYVSLVAEAGDVYRSELEFTKLEPAQ